MKEFPVLRGVPKPAKVQTLGQLESVYDRWFSRFIRLRDADDDGMVHCVTCEKYIHWKRADCGHYIKRGHSGTRYDERNCHPQCGFCNRQRHGENQAHRMYIAKRYGKDMPDILRQLGRPAKHLTREEYEQGIEHYKQIVKANPHFNEKLAEIQKGKT